MQISFCLLLFSPLLLLYVYISLYMEHGHIPWVVSVITDLTLAWTLIRRSVMHTKHKHI